MQVSPALDEGSVTWAHQSQSMIAIGVWTEKKPGRGEDAEPLVLYQYPAGRGVLAVCDGVGGAGVQAAGRTADGTERSGAWVSARVVRLAVEEYFVRLVHHDSAPAHQATGALSLHESVNGALRPLRNPSRSRIGGTMQRELPSTLAAIFYREQKGSIRVHVRWAGDSRCYLLTGEAGLQQLSQDDTDTPDALSSLEQDPPMTNQIVADGRYRIHDEPDDVTTPCVLLCATDGFFNYVQTPAHFEYVLLSALRTAPDPAAWARSLARAVRDYTQDDASLALVALGYQDFGHLRRAFDNRLSTLFQEHWQPFQELASSDDDAFRKARLESWQLYRNGYEERISYKAGERQ